MRISLMIEGQEDVTWDQWLALARACEEAGLEGLFRSDHYYSVVGRGERGSLDAWTTLAALAARTERIRLGTMVSPTTFRHPSVLAKAVVTADHVSGGRVELGMGAGWHEVEHRAYGFPFHDVPTRMEVLDEQLEIVHRSWSEGPFDFRGRHFAVEGLDALPKPLQRPHPNLIVGGMAGPRGAAIAARFADEYNTTYARAEEATRRRERLTRAWEREGRDPSTLVFSMMTGCVVGADRDEVTRRAGAVLGMMGAAGADPAEWMAGMRDRWVIGTVEEVVERLRELETAGVQRIMLQHHPHTDLDMVRLIGAEVVPKLA